MLLPRNENTVTICGNISKVDIKNGKFGRFGSINVALDDSYFDKKSNQRIEKTTFVTVEIQDSFLKKVENPATGDRIHLSGKLILDQFKDAHGNDRQILKVKCQAVIAHVSKQAKELLKANGFIGKQQPQQSQGGYQDSQANFNNQPQQGGYQQPQGGFNQPQQGGYHQPKGGFNQQGGYQ